MTRIGSQTEENKSFVNISNDQFNEMMRHPDTIILDVRTGAEFQSARIPGSRMIDIYEPDFSEKLEQLNRSKKYLVYCRAGHRSVAACSEMIRLGFSDIYNLINGISGWDGEIIQG